MEACRASVPSQMGRFEPTTPARFEECPGVKPVGRSAKTDGSGLQIEGRRGAPRVQVTD